MLVISGGQFFLLNNDDNFVIIEKIFSEKDFVFSKG